MSKRAYVIGSPIAHSLSPAMHNAAFAALGLDAAYASVEVEPADLGAWVESIRVAQTLGLIQSGTVGTILGFNVTLPHKIAIQKHLDAVEGDATLAGAVNTVTASAVSGRRVVLVGTNTDTVGFRRLLAEEGSMFLAGRDVVLLGAGGAARAVALVALQDHARSLLIANRHLERAKQLLDDLAPVNQGTRVEGVALTDDRLRTMLAQGPVVINATSVGLASADSPIDPKVVSAASMVVDLIYNPTDTALLRGARKQGAQTLGGLGMLVYQAAAAFELWTGAEAPVEVMRATAELSLRGASA